MGFQQCVFEFKWSCCSALGVTQVVLLWIGHNLSTFARTGPRGDLHTTLFNLWILNFFRKQTSSSHTQGKKLWIYKIKVKEYYSFGKYIAACWTLLAWMMTWDICESLAWACIYQIKKSSAEIILCITASISVHICAFNP